MTEPSRTAVSINQSLRSPHRLKPKPPNPSFLFPIRCSNLTHIHAGGHQKLLNLADGYLVSVEDGRCEGGFHPRLLEDLVEVRGTPCPTGRDDRDPDRLSDRANERDVVAVVLPVVVDAVEEDLARPKRLNSLRHLDDI
eukprot:CAMPEP_0184378588 /NCGR_PEP_ID=MMETSP0007-20130409/3199_1 /TAXON_ID=97485 /ORGANISM="Prymnesium parvum, Strain Texoma1" /LENGTH=138 /DNA_ID=CAMNT_0026722941 /DNA_START=285 /DNA_END=700 /DNA_ORIENTATION=+